MTAFSRILILGDSHASSLVRAKNKHAEEFADFQIHTVAAGRLIREFTLALASGETIVNPIVMQALVDARVLGPTYEVISRDTAVCFLFGSNHHTITNNDTFHGYCVQEGPTPESGALVLGNLPRALLDDAMDDRLAKLKDGLTVLQRILGDRCWMILGPPIQRHSEVFANAVRPVSGPLPEENVRLAIYDAALRALKRLATTSGMRLLDPNPHFGVKDGFLAPEFSRDGTHANTEYGALVLRNLRALIHGG